MKYRDIQGYARQPSIIHTRLFVWQDSLPETLLSESVSDMVSSITAFNKHEYMDGHIRGFRREGDELFQTGIWEDKVQGTIITKLREHHIQEAADHYAGQELIIVPVHCRRVRVEAQMFI